MQNPELHKQAAWARERLTDATAHSGGHALTLRGSVQSRTPREAAEVPEAQQQQRPGKKQRAKQEQEATRGIRAFFSSAQPRGQSGTIGCPTLSATRRCHQYTQNTQDGPGLRHALQNSGRRDHVENNSRFGVSWKELQTARQTDCAKRIALIKGVVMELQTRAKALLEKPEKNQLVQMGWLAQPDGREPAWNRLLLSRKKYHVQMQGLPVSDAQRRWRSCSSTHRAR